MDKFLTKEEKKELCELLQIPTHCYGALPFMKVHYKKMCKVYHPDKGGDGIKMQRLNELWNKLQESVYGARQENSSPEVSGPRFFWEADFETLGAYLGPTFKDRMCKNPSCIFKPGAACCCICCMLAKQHKIIKLMKDKRCLVWGECFCYCCYLQWFGFHHDEEAFAWWCRILGETELCLLNLFDSSKWGK
ncbi:small T antigen [Taphozous melanopogon polyomavirus 1]|nr:small T antigen [Taphozous melanopogon polyomavirus 1]